MAANRYDQITNFVEPYRAPAQPAQVIEVEAVRELPVAPQTVLMPRAGYEDRARGFGIATLPLAASVGFVVALIAIVGWRVPVASLVTLLLALAGFATTWLVAYLAHVIVSPDGATFAHVWLAWKYLNDEAKDRRQRYGRYSTRREQKERHRRYQK